MIISSNATEEETFNLDDILAPGWFDQRITDVGTKQDFIDWWNSQVYHKIEYHDFTRVEKIVTRYEKFRSNENGYNELAKITTEFPELYSPKEKKLYVFLPDARGDAKFRLSVFSDEGAILTHKEFDDRESALRYAVKEGCTKEVAGMMDSFIETDAFNRSIVMYEAQCKNMSLDDYIMKSRNPEIRELYSERIQFLKRVRRKENKYGGLGL